jgi:hypothetical protein
MLSALSKSFTYPSQVAAAIGKFEAERIAAKEREKERGKERENTDTECDVSGDGHCGAL